MLIMMYKAIIGIGIFVFVMFAYNKYVEYTNNKEFMKRHEADMQKHKRPSVR